MDYCTVPLRLYLQVDKWHKTLGEPPLIDQIVAVAVDEAHCVYEW